MKNIFCLRFYCFVNNVLALGALLLASIKFNSSMNKLSHIHYKVWDDISYPVACFLVGDQNLYYKTYTKNQTYT